MRATIWGCRGSLATPGRGTLRYGGNTSCVEVSLDDGTLVILDAGTGIRSLGLELAREERRLVHIVLTHLHLDHIEGLGFFAPIWRAETELHVWGPPSPLRSLGERLGRYFSAPLFPVELTDIPARLVLHDVPSEPWEIGSARISAEPVLHPGPTLGFRVEADGASLAYIPDHEPTLGIDLASLTPDWISGFPIAEGADVLLHDAQYTEEEYPDKIGWGHSSVAGAVTFARLTGAGRLVLFHHDPMRADDDVAALEERARELWEGGSPPPAAAFDGMQIEVGRPGGSADAAGAPLSQGFPS